MPTATRTFRLFVSSTFEDLREERNALAAPGGPFAELTKLCQSFGARFQAIDLRWGVREEAGHDQRTMEICLGEIERCQRTGIKPNFIILLGDRYGWRPLPARIEAGEFRAVRDRIVDPEGRARVDDWYRLDENAVPAEYLLEPRTAEFIDKDRWAAIEAAMHKALREAARAAGLSGTALIKYESSATHQEILKGLGKTAEDREHVFAFLCKLSEPNEDPDLAKLKNFLRDELKGNVFAPHDTAELCERVRENLKRVIRTEAAAFQSRPALDIEVEAHDAFARDRARHFTGRKDVLDSINEYLKGGDRRPMVVHGASGSGKSAVMARALEALLGNPGKAVVIRRFIGVTPESSSGITLLRSLCEEIGRRYGVTEEIPVEFHSVVRTFTGRLVLATTDRPLVLFIDALDQIAASDPAADITWLTAELPRYCRVVVSTTDVARSLERTRRSVLGALPARDAEGALSLWLHNAERELRDWQREKVLTYYSGCGLPLYLRLAFDESRRWKSFDEPEACALKEGLAGIIDTLLDRLSSGGSHGKFLVSRSLGYLAAARYGLTEDEMLDVLTEDESVWREFDTAKHHDPPERRLPVIVWSRLFLDLEPYLMERASPGGTVATFYHRQLRERIDDRYLAESQSKERHEALAGYFGKQPYWLEATWRQPNARMAVELVYQQQRSCLVDAVATTLTDLSFVAAKCSAGLVFDLQEDYQESVAALPEARKQVSLSNSRQARVTRWAKELLAYSRACAERRQTIADALATEEPEPVLPEIPDSIVPWSDERIASECNRLNTDPTRLDRLLMFAGFVTSEFYPLLQFGSDPGFVVQLAYNLVPGGSVHAAAEAIVTSTTKLLVLRIWPSGESPGLKPPLVRVLEGHAGDILAIDVTPDGLRAVSTGDDSMVRVWDLENGHCLHTWDLMASRPYKNSTDPGVAVAVSADCKRVISITSNRNICICDVEYSQRRRSIWSLDELRPMAITPDGQRAVFGCRIVDNNVVWMGLSVWELDTWLCVRVMKGHSKDVTAVSITPDGTRAISGSLDNTLKMWALETGQCLFTLEGHTDGVISVSITPSATRAASASRDGTVRIWDLEKQTCLQVIPNDKQYGSVSFIPDGRRVILANKTLLRLWDVDTGKCLRSLPGLLHVATLSPDGSRVIGSLDRTLQIVDIETGQVPDRNASHSESVSCISLTANGRRAISGSRDKTLRVWDAATGECIKTLAGNSWFTSVVVMPDGQSAISAGTDQPLRLWDLETGRCVNTMGGYASEVSATPDGSYAISGGWGGRVRVWHPQTTRCIRELDTSTNLSKMKLVADGRWAVCIGHEYPSGNVKSIKVWDLETGACLRVLDGHTDVVASLDVTPDGLRAVSGGGGSDRTVRVWNLENGSCVHVLEGHTAPVLGVSIAANGTRAVSGSMDHTLRLWDLEDGNCLAIVCLRPYSSCSSIAASADLSRVAVGTDEGYVLFFDIKGDDHGIDLSCACGVTDALIGASLLLSPDQHYT